MSNDPVGRRPRSADLHSTLRIAALAAVALGVVLLAAAAFVLSYEGIHHIALRAGVSPRLAKLYPLIFDVMLVVAAAAALALRGAGWWARCYAWGSLLILLAAMAAGNAVYAIGSTLPAEPTKAALAVIPWVLLLMAFGLLLEMLRHFRTTRSSSAMATEGTAASGAAVAGTVVGADVNGAAQAATQAAASGGKMREIPRVDLDTLLGPRAGEPPAIAILHGIRADESDGGHQIDPVSYGEETGYVHPDSYLDEGEYSPHGDTGGPGTPEGLAGDTAGNGAHLARHGTAPAETSVTPAEGPTAPAESPLTTAGHPATPVEPPARPAAAPATPTEPPAHLAVARATAADPPANPAVAPATAAETPATTEQSASPAAAPATTTEPPTSAEPSATPAEAPTTPAETPATTAENPAAAAVATAAPVGATAGGAASGMGNGLAAGGGPAGAGGGPAGDATTAGQNGAAESGQGGADVKQEAVGVEGPALERIRSSPTRPEE